MPWVVKINALHIQTLDHQILDMHFEMASAGGQQDKWWAITNGTFANEADNSVRPKGGQMVDEEDFMKPMSLETHSIHTI